jgi:hypothetical protein
MERATVQSEQTGRVAVVRFARPERANAVNVQMLLDLRDALSELEADDEVRVVVVTGAGRHFCGGWDLTETAPVPPGLDINTCFGLVTKPLIAALNGGAMDGDCEIALACDYRFAAAHATIGLPEIMFRELPAAGGTVRLSRVVGPSAAKRLILTGEPLTAEQAHRGWTCFTRHPGLVLVLARGRSAPAAGSATAQAWLSCRVAGTDLVADAPHDLVPECTPVGEQTGLLPPPDEFGDSRQGPGGLDGALKGTGARWPGRVWTGTGARRGPAVRQGQRKRRFCVGAVR